MSGVVKYNNISDKDFKCEIESINYLKYIDNSIIITQTNYILQRNISTDSQGSSF